MKFAFAVFILISLSAVSSQLTQTWLLDWQTTDTTCAPVNFQITASPTGGYSITYGYSSQTLNNYECETYLGITTNFSSTLTLNTTSGAYVDSKNQSLIYSTNNTIQFSLGNPAYQTSWMLFTPNGAYVSQDEVAGLVAGAWTGLSYNQSACQTIPPTNITISITQYYDVTAPHATYYTSSSNYPQTTTLDLTIPQINQFIWSFTYSGSSNISFSVNPTTNQSTLQISLYQSLIYGECIATYTRSNNFFSGTYLPDWQNGNYQNTTYSHEVPTSIQVTNIYNQYMRISFNFANGTSNTGILYSGNATTYTDSFYGDFYYPSSNTFLLNIAAYSTKFLFSANGSVFDVNTIVGKWSSPLSEYAYESDVSDYCCIPTGIDIYDLVSDTNLSALFHFDSDTASSQGCNNLKYAMSSNTYLRMNFLIHSPNGTQLIYSSQYDYYISFNNSDTSQLQVYFDYEGANCNFAMTGYDSPQPLSAQLIAKGISILIFALIAIFI